MTGTETPVASSSVTTAQTIINPHYESWIANDQLLLGWLYNSMMPEVATQVMGRDTAKGVVECIARTVQCAISR